MKKLVRSSFIAVMMLSLLLTVSCASKKANSEDQDVVPGEKPVATESMIIDHRHTDLKDVPLEWINKAKTDLHIAYGHTSHGSQITDGMSGLVSFANAPTADRPTPGTAAARTAPWTCAIARWAAMSAISPNGWTTRAVTWEI